MGKKERENKREREEEERELLVMGKFLSRERTWERDQTRGREKWREQERGRERGRLSSARLFLRWKQFPSQGDMRRDEREEHGRDGGGIFLLLPLTRAYAHMQERRKEDGEERGVTREREREREHGR